MKTKRQRVLVTGSSRGIGKEIALELAAEGWRVAVHYSHNDKEAKIVAQELGDSFAGLYQADLADPKQADSLWKAATISEPLHALVNNAGVYYPHRFNELSDDAFWTMYERTMAINFESPVRLMRRAAASFASAGGGKILNVASRVGFRGEAGASMYSASKAALINVTRALAVELAPQNIQLFGIAPGWVETAMAREGMGDRLPAILKDIPLGRMAKPEDCANVAAFLLSEKANYLSGVTIDINGASYFH